MICQNCSSTFPSYVRINGKLKGMHKRKYCLDCSPFGSHKTRHPNHDTLPPEKFCRRCSQTLSSDQFYTRRSGSGLMPYCKPCTNDEAMDRQRRLKVQCVLYRGGECQICGYDACAAAMDFHHIDPAQKDFSISHYKKTSFDKIKDELDKCILLCCRCHREVECGFTDLQCLPP